jgi:AcrR family transcriptional regulator
MAAVNPPRRYHSPRRQAQARTTRRRIAAAGRRLFARDGYARTTIEAIAREARVAVQTIYFFFGSKRAVCVALVDAMEQEVRPELLALLREAGVATPEGRQAAGETVAVDAPGGTDLLEAVLAADLPPSAQLALVVAFTRRLFQRGADVLALLRAASQTEPDLAATWQEGERRRRRNSAQLVAGWSGRGALRAGVPEQEAIDVLWALTDPELYRLLVDDSGWAPERYEAWLTATLSSLLFG